MAEVEKIKASKDKVVKDGKVFVFRFSTRPKRDAPNAIAFFVLVGHPWRHLLLFVRNSWVSN